jgi:hypothetical protein
MLYELWYADITTGYVESHVQLADRCVHLTI